MKDVSVAKVALGLLGLLVVGYDIVAPLYPSTIEYDFLAILVALIGIELVVEGAGPRSARIRILEWRTSRTERAIEWVLAFVAVVLIAWDTSPGPFAAAMFVVLLYSAVYWGTSRYQNRATEELERLRRQEQTGERGDASR